jgi:hypothetical protein
MRHGNHNEDGKHNEHGKHKNPGNPPLAGAEGPLVPQPGAGAVLAALAVATLLGVAGGWVLRVSSPR